jgi:hypothetical protein
MQPSSMPLFRREAPWLLVFVLGLTPWLFLADLAKVREAWDSPLFMTMVLPAITLCCAIGGWISPSRSWMVPLSAVAGQFVGWLLKAPPDNPVFLVLGMVTMLILHAPALGASLAAAALRRRLDRRS